ncbi:MULTISPECIES: hypothetical protein [unclassified Mycolicibacterium]|nr:MULTISPECIES: hypothetical protein [unclassified Mycolicibacterium]
MASTIEFGDGIVHTVENVTIHLADRLREDQSIHVTRNASGITSAELYL